MKSLILLLSVTLATPVFARDPGPRESVRVIHTYGPDLTFQRRVGQLMLIGGLTSSVVHMYAMSSTSKLAGFILYGIYRETAFPMAFVGTFASFIAAGVGGFVVALSPAPKRYTRFTHYRTAEGFPDFMRLSEEEQLDYMSKDPELAAFVRDLARRAAETRPLP